MIEQVMDLATPDGTMNTYVYRPEEGGPHPLIVFLIDSAGVREALADLCRRLASAGYCVAMPNLFYRKARYLDVNVDRLTDPAYGEALETMWRLNRSLNQDGVMSDIRHLLDHLAGSNEVSSQQIGVIGYCMSGHYAFRAAAEFADRVRATACVYGVHYFTDNPDSPHTFASRITGELYAVMAEHDHYVPSGTDRRLDEVCKAAGVNVRVEMYPGTEHGFALPGRRAYNKAASERHWERLHALFRRNLQKC